MSSDLLNKKNVAKNISKIVFTNIISLLSGILVGFLLPKMIGVSDYGYYKTFTLYAGYVGLLHFGFIDGIYLKFGGNNYNELDYCSFRFYTRLLLLVELFLSFVGLSISFAFLRGDLQYIFLFVSLYIVGHNMMTYFQYISQITGRFTELSIINIVNSFLIMSSIAVVFIQYKISGQMQNYKLFLALYSSIPFVLDAVYVVAYRKIVFGKSKVKSSLFFESWKLVLLGVPLMVANLCSSLILSIDRQFVNILFDNETYAVYAFAYNMLALITTAISAVSIVIYPMMKRMKEGHIFEIYNKISAVLIVFVFACLIVYFPLKWFIPTFLPAYTGSLPIFRIILPGLALSSTISIIMHNCYKTEGREKLFFLKTLLILAISIVFNTIAYLIFKTTMAISIVSIAALVIWYLLVERYFIVSHGVKWIRNFLYSASLMAGFYLITIINSWWLSMVAYFAYYLAITFFVYKNEIFSFLKKKKEAI